MSQNVASSITLGTVSPNVTFNGNWTVKIDTVNTYNLYNATDTWSNQKGATATLNFYGNAVEYWSNRNPQHGPCDITLDNNLIATVTSNAPAIGSPIILYSTSNLTLEEHTLVVTVKNGSGANRCSVDHWVVNVTSSTPSTSTNSPSIAVIEKPSTYVILGGVIGGIMLLSLFLFVFWWYRRRKSPHSSIISPYGSKAPIPPTPVLPTTFNPSEQGMFIAIPYSQIYSQTRPWTPTTKRQREEQERGRGLESTEMSSTIGVSGTGGTDGLDSVEPPPAYRGY